MTTPATFTEQQVDDYLTTLINKVVRKTYAYQNMVFGAKKADGEILASVDWSINSDTDDISLETILYVNDLTPGTLHKLHEFTFRNITDEDFCQLLIDTFISAGLPSDMSVILSILSNLERQYNTPDTVVIDITGGVVEEITSNLPVDVIVLDSDLESLDSDDLKHSIELDGTVFVPHNTGIPQINSRRVNDIYQAIHKNEQKLQQDKENRINSELLTQADYDRFNEIFRVETRAMGRSVLSPSLRGLEYVDEEVYGKEKEMRLIPLKLQGQQFELIIPINKDVKDMIADFVKLSKLYNFDAKLVQENFLEV